MWGFRRWGRGTGSTGRTAQSRRRSAAAYLAFRLAAVGLGSRLQEKESPRPVGRIGAPPGPGQATFMEALRKGHEPFPPFGHDNNDVEITAQDAVKDVVPFEG